MPSRERYDLALSIVLGMGDHQTMKDLVDEVISNALNELVESHAIEEWQVSADSTDLPGPTAAEMMDIQVEADIAESRHPDPLEDLNPEHHGSPPPVDPRTQKDEPDQ